MHIYKQIRPAFLSRPMFFTHLPLYLSVKWYIQFPLALQSISELFCHAVSHFLSSLTQLDVTRKNLLTPNSVRVCYPEKRCTPHHAENRDFLIIYVCSWECAVVVMSHKLIMAGRTMMLGDIHHFCNSCIRVKDETSIYKDNLSYLKRQSSEKPDLACKDKIEWLSGSFFYRVYQFILHLCI